MEKIYHLLTLAVIGIYWMLTAAVTIRILTKRRSIGVSIAWLLLIFVIPLVGIFAYLLFGELNLGRKRAKLAKEMFDPYSNWFTQLHQLRQYRPDMLNQFSESISSLCEKRLGIPALADNQMQLFDTPNKILYSLIEDIKKAEKSINMEFYIWSPGGLADDVATALMEAASRGVRVKILLDAAGSRRFFKSHWLRTLRSANITVAQALPVSPFRMFFQRIDLRLHRKIVVIDNKIAYTGSMNLVDPAFFKQNAGVGEWIDVMVRMTGSNVPVLNCINAWDWETETGERNLPSTPNLTPHTSQDIRDIVQVIPSGPGMPESIIQQVLLQSIYQAEHRIVITTPYFIPSENLQFAMVSAAQRGVSVNIIVPNKNDSIMVEWASRSFFDELLRAGVNIYRYKDGLLHTKSVVIDDSHCLIGTVNLDMRSLWLNFEVTLAVDEYQFTQDLIKLHNKYISESEIISFESWRKRKLPNRFMEQFFYWFSPLL